ncbi:hypothetical protein JOB18_011147 [Solea senegalensis]|uniref:Uncharacterized protein n=1 Tax=Solea senegalensis TaxID=28829 RepID=A0AAV6PQ93_SOLSE|nr:hypothetical protein JOB18_011147 [Solea senegalensis]
MEQKNGNGATRRLFGCSWQRLCDGDSFSVIPPTENNRACKLAKLKLLVRRVLIGDDSCEAVISKMKRQQIFDI